MHHFITSVRIQASCEDVFDFHTITGNLEKISTRDVKLVKFVESGTGVGKTIDLTLRWRGIMTMHWLIVLEAFERPKTIVDLQVKGPFKYFRHARTFTAMSATETELRDEVHYQLPFGFLGVLVEKAIVNRVFAKQFAYRHLRTKQLLDQKSLESV